jgi:hypothetical protein
MSESIQVHSGDLDLLSTEDQPVRDDDWMAVNEIPAGRGTIRISRLVVEGELARFSITTFCDRNEGPPGPRYSRLRRVVCDPGVASMLADALDAAVDEFDGASPQVTWIGRPNEFGFVRGPDGYGVMVQRFTGWAGPMVAIVEYNGDSAVFNSAPRRAVACVCARPALVRPLARLLREASTAF